MTKEQFDIKINAKDTSKVYSYKNGIGGLCYWVFKRDGWVTVYNSVQEGSELNIYQLSKKRWYHSTSKKINPFFKGIFTEDKFA